MQKIAVLISGSGSNLKAIIDSTFKLNIACVISNKKDASGLRYAIENNIPHYVIPHNEYSSKQDFEQKMIDIIQRYACELVILAGFMRVLTPHFVNYFYNKIINIHPSLLPSFIGMDTHTRAIADGVKISGATIHLVNNELDAGQILLQAVVNIEVNDTPTSLQTKIQKLEHVAYPFVIYKLSTNQYDIINKKCSITHNETDYLPTNFYY